MKKLIAIVLMVLCIFAFIRYQERNDISHASIDYGDSKIYTKEDMDAAIAVIKEEFRTWKGCRMKSISYGSDEQCNAENLEWMNSLQDQADKEGDFTQCIMFLSDFHTSSFADGGFEENSDYTEWEWWLARTDGGEWKLMTWGY